MWVLGLFLCFSLSLWEVRGEVALALLCAAPALRLVSHLCVCVGFLPCFAVFVCAQGKCFVLEGLGIKKNSLDIFYRYTWQNLWRRTKLLLCAHCHSSGRNTFLLQHGVLSSICCDRVLLWVLLGVSLWPWPDVQGRVWKEKWGGGSAGFACSLCVYLFPSPCV